VRSEIVPGHTAALASVAEQPAGSATAGVAGAADNDRCTRGAVPGYGTVPPIENGRRSAATAPSRSRTPAPRRWAPCPLNCSAHW